MDSNSGRQSLDQIPLWRHAADYVALDPYPCYQGKPCDFGWVDTVIKAADRAGLHYWGVAQAFDDANWRWPTPAELRHILSQWSASKESGYMTFAWSWRGQTLGEQAGTAEGVQRLQRDSREAQVEAEAQRSETEAAKGVATSKGGARAARRRARRPSSITPYGGPTSVTFNWDGTASALRYGRTKRYGSTIRAEPPTVIPSRRTGRFRQLTITGLKPGRTYHYSVGNVASTFSTPPVGRFRFDFEADVGASNDFDTVTVTQKQIVADRPAFVIVAGDLTYGNDEGLAAVDRHFNDVMVWSRSAAYMPAWGNHEWDKSSDDMRNYKGRFRLPHPQTSPDAPSKGCCGQDWGWFDAGAVRFIAYPEPYSYNSWRDWLKKAGPLMDAAQRNPKIHFIVTFGHRPAYSTGYHPGDPLLAAEMNTLGDRYSKYVLNLNGHSHNYERFLPIHHVVHITAGGGGADLEPWSRGKDSKTAFRALHLEHLRVDVTAKQLRVQAICGPPTSHQDFSCALGSSHRLVHDQQPDYLVFLAFAVIVPAARRGAAATAEVETRVLELAVAHGNTRAAAAFTVDVEDWYQSCVDYDAPITERVVRNVDRVRRRARRVRRQGDVLRPGAGRGDLPAARAGTSSPRATRSSRTDTAIDRSSA